MRTSVPLFTYTASLFIKDDYLGTFPISVPSNWRPSLAYFCSNCGDIWARLVASRDGSAKAYQPLCVGCMACGDSYSVPGSVLYGAWYDLLSQLPADALRREFFTHLTWAEQCLTKPHLQWRL